MSGPQHSSSTKRMLAMMPEPAAWETPSGPGGAATSESTESRSAAWRGLSSSSGRKASLRDDELRGESPNEVPRRLMLLTQLLEIADGSQPLVVYNASRGKPHGWARETHREILRRRSEGVAQHFYWLAVPDGQFDNPGVG